MFRFYRYLFYRVYSWRLKREADVPRADTILFFTLLHWFIFMPFGFYASERLGVNLTAIFNNQIYVRLVLGIGALLPINLFFWKVINLDACVEEFKDESEAQRRKGTICLWLFIVGSFLPFIIFFMFF